ncbi:MAG: DUF4625 domain-containing protein [Prevotellaceae bacterium]|jgi:hypothetical protein|nr:DUF4625 domain-containing protein [Prevotellaceae bacterium]
MKTKFFLYVAIFALTLAACSDDKDTTGPEIKLLQPENEAVFTRGDAISIVFDLADPSGVNAYKIDIHYAGDEHAHSHALDVTPAHEDEEEEPWEFLEIYDDQKGKTSAHVEKTVTVPNDIHGGEYHLGILATDNEGNESQAYIDIDIEE